MQSVVPQQNANGEGGKEPRCDSGHPGQGLPIPTFKNARNSYRTVSISVYTMKCKIYLHAYYRYSKQRTLQ